MNDFGPLVKNVLQSLDSDTLLTLVQTIKVKKCSEVWGENVHRSIGTICNVEIEKVVAEEILRF